MNIFEKIYKKNKWNVGSGEGSRERYTRKYRIFLENFLKQHDIKSVLDFGCGDWQFSKHVRWGDIQYQGVDVVRSVIDQNKDKYEKDNITFSLIDQEQSSGLPSADLFIAKDVLQHWSTERIKKFLPKLKNYKYVLVTNCSDLPKTRNSDIEDGGFRTLDLTAAPFYLNGKYIFSFSTREPSFKNIIKWMLPHQLRGLDYNNKKVLFIDNSE